MTTHNFGLVGVGGFVAPRHLKAIRDTGNTLVAATDPSDSVGVLDGYFPEAKFFTEIERFDRHLEKLRRLGEDRQIHYLSVCTPNYLHDAHVRLAMRVGAHAICEKPLVINPWNLDQLAELEQEYGKRIYTIMQLRYHPALLELRERLQASPPSKPADVVLSYISRRGPWYHVSWKGNPEKSGGLGMNLGVHFFDLLIWLFGPVQSTELHLDQKNRMSGLLRLERANVRWFLSVDLNDLPQSVQDAGQTALRTLLLDGQEVEFSGGFTDLHTRVYEKTLAGEGLGIAEARPAIDLLYQIRQAEAVSPGESAHPFLKGETQ